VVSALLAQALGVPAQLPTASLHWQSSLLQLWLSV
jgi:hypothetical protein